ncbi:MAG: ATP-dependent DNA helicase DinG [Treponema sp.]|jgi:ATP-dependent DNA helicase DinG|nr:ATP-dependent DNA helicase DinG [Treponema sp.]
MLAIKRFSKPCIAQLQAEIQDAGGNEVFALGFLDKQGLVSTLEVSARGKEDKVLAVDKRLETADVFIHNHPSGLLTPSDADLGIAAQVAQVGVGCFIVDNQVKQVYVVVEPTKKRSQKKLHAATIIAALEAGGTIAKRLPVYENRRSQLDLMRLIIQGFNEDALVAAEAGTGVGKSFAYLLPALHYALANDERIVISTATITLQQQLYEKDIPLVASVIEEIEASETLEKAEKKEKKLKVVLIKGRGHYLCRRRFEAAFQEQSFVPDGDYEDLLAIRAWTETTKTGSRSDLSFMPAEGLWSRICAEVDCCMGMHCPEREGCFVLALRKESADARILVVNHHLLFADLAARHEGAGYNHTVVLPPYTRVIIDEAHTVEEAATSFFSQEFSRLGINRHMGRLYRRTRGGSPLGLLLTLAALVSAEPQLEALEAAIREIRDTADTLDYAALELCHVEGVFRLTPARDQIIQGTLVPRFTALRKLITAFTGRIRDLLDQVAPQDEDNPTVWEVKSILRRLDTIGTICTAFIEFKERTAEVLWIERHVNSSTGPSRGPWVVFTVSPIAVAPSLNDALFQPNKTVVCVSATLTVADSFAYWNVRCGLSLVRERQVLTGQFPSPFPYSSSVLLGIPKDAPLPNQDPYQGFVDQAVVALTQCAGGSALVLFTSYEALRSAYTAAVPVLEPQGIRCLKQGDDDRNRLLRTFLADEQSVLFATDSFWEGVDAPGDTLRLVILCRLPFRTPHEPVFEARCEALQKQGANPFMELSLPESVMKFKQGFGRLIRRSSDRGVVAVLDGRILWKRYGAFFLRSLPKTKTSFEDFETILRQTEQFLYP